MKHLDCENVVQEIDFAAVLAAIREMLEATLQVHKALGAPGDYGYDSKEGKALKRLYQAHGKLLKAAKAERKEP